MFTYFPSFFLYSQLRGVKPELRSANQPVIYSQSVSQSVSSVLILTSRAYIPLRGKSKVPLAQVTEYKKKIKNQSTPTNASTGGNGYNSSFRRLVDTLHIRWRDGGRKEVSREGKKRKRGGSIYLSSGE